MRTLKYLLVVIIMVVLVLDVSVQAQSVIKQLREGREQEKAGDLDAAIQTYEQITTNIEANQRQVSQAYYRMGMCYLRKEDKEQAKQQFEHLVTEFPRSLSAVANARRELRKIQRRERDTEPREDRWGVIGQRPKINEAIPPTGPPTVVRTDPANFADNVPADLKQISVTFDQQMMNRSWSWTQLDRKTFPKMVGRPRYDRERKTCTLRVKLKPGTLYFVGINYNPLERSPSARGETRLRRGFKSTSGQAAKPYALVFATADVMGRSRPIPEEMVAKAKAINSATETDVEPSEPEPKTLGQELFHDDGFKLGRTGFASISESYVRFETPKPNSYLKAVRIFGVRPSEVETTDPYIHILVCDADFTAIADFQFPLDRFEPRFRDWVTLTIEPTKIPSKFAIGLSHQGKALAVAFNPGKSTNSFFKKPGVGVRPYSGGDWLIRAIVSDSPDIPIKVPKGPGSGEGIEGIWLGALKVAEMERRVVFKISKRLDGALNATLDSPDRGAQNTAADKVDFKNGRLHVQVKSIMGVFDGTMKADGSTIEGQWKQGGQSMPLVLKRSDEIPGPRRPQEPKKPYPYNEEEVVCENKTDGVKLAGTLTLPNLEGRCPAVLLISGSDPHDRNGAMMGHKPFLVLADHLTRQGIAVLRVDDRGVGVSTGDCFEATSEDFAGDVLAGVEYLKSRKEISAKQIGLIGHSEGGIIAPMAAVRSPDVAFIVMMAGTGLIGEEVLYLQTTMFAKFLKARGVSDHVAAAGRAQQEKLFAIIKEERDNAVAAKRIRELLIGNLSKKLSEDEKEALEAMEAALEPQIKLLLSPWFRFFLTYDPKPTLSKVRCPVLAIVGEKDLQVAPKENMRAIEGALKAGGNTRYTIRELPNLNHLFQTAETGWPDEYAKIEESISPDALSLISKWIRQTVKDEHPGSDEDGHVGPRISEDVGPDEDWGRANFVFAPPNKKAVKLRISRVTDDAIEDVITERLKKMTDGSSYSWMGRKVGDNLYVQLSPVRDVDAFIEKIDFGKVIARKGRRVVVKAKSNWTDEDFRFGPDPEYTVRLIIIGVTDTAAEDAIKEKLKQLMGGGQFYLAWSKIQSTVTADVAPVDDVGAFVKKIDFVGTVTSIRGRRVEVKVGGTTR